MLLPVRAFVDGSWREFPVRAYRDGSWVLAQFRRHGDSGWWQGFGMTPFGTGPFGL